MSYTKKLVDSVIGFDKSSISTEVIEHTKWFVLDTIGCGLGGYATLPGRQIISQAKRFQGAETATLMGDGSKVSAPFACWANSSMVNILDMDDVYAGTAHQANCLVPTALGVGEMIGAAGREVLEAVIIGFEVGSRIMMYCWPSPSKARTYYPSTWQVFDAVTAAGALLKLDSEKLYNAFGLAGIVAPLPLDMQKFVERPIGFAKNVFGWTTFTGVFWAQMAKIGAQGVADIFDGDAGFWTIMGSDQRDYNKLMEGFGKNFNIMKTKYKPYPLCTWGHSTVDCFSQIMLEHNIKPQDIEFIQVHTIQRAVDFLSNPKMQTIYDAQFSLPHALAMTALGKKPGPEWMSEENMFKNEEAKRIASTVTMETDPGAEDVFNEEKGLAIPTEVTVRTAGGKVFCKNLKYSKGTPNNPFSQEELKFKFQTLASSVFDEKMTEKIFQCVMNLDEVEEVSELTKILKE